LKELIDLQRETMHKTDIDRMEALELVTAYESATERIRPDATQTTGDCVQDRQAEKSQESQGMYTENKII